MELSERGWLKYKYTLNTNEHSKWLIGIYNYVINEIRNRKFKNIIKLIWKYSNRFYFLFIINKSLNNTGLSNIFIM